MFQHIFKSIFYRLAEKSSSKVKYCFSGMLKINDFTLQDGDVSKINCFTSLCASGSCICLLNASLCIMCVFQIPTMSGFGGRGHAGLLRLGIKQTHIIQLSSAELYWHDKIRFYCQSFSKCTTTASQTSYIP